MLVADFSSLVKNGSVKVTEDALWVAVDLTMAVTGKTRNQSGEQLRTLDSHLFSQVRSLDKLIN